MAESKAISREAGFTLIEVIVAGMLTMVLAIPTFSFLTQTYRLADLMRSRARQSEEARQILGLLGDGTASFGTQSNPRGFNMVEGLRSRSAIPATWPLRSPTVPSQFIMSDTGPQIAGDTMAPVTINCAGAGMPIPDCVATERRSVQGWLGSDPTLVSVGQPSGVPVTASVGISVTDPWRARQVSMPSGGVTESFRSMFTLNVEGDP